MECGSFLLYLCGMHKSFRTLWIGVMTMVITSLIFSCDSCVKASGNVVTEERILSAATGIIIEGKMSVQITQGATQFIEVKADDNVLKYIQTYKSGNNIVFSIDGNKCFKKESTIEVYVTLPTIQHIQLDSDGSIKGMNCLKTDSLSILHRGFGKIELQDTSRTVYVQSTGNGSVYVNGEATSIKLENRGQGFLNFKDFTTSNAQVIVTNFGGVAVNVSQSLTGEISSAGNILYYGNPTSVSVLDNGSGDAIAQ